MAVAVGVRAARFGREVVGVRRTGEKQVPRLARNDNFLKEIV